MVTGFGPQVHEGGTAIVNNDHCEVWSTCGEGLLFPFSGRNSKYCCQDEGIGDGDEEEGDQEDQQAEDENTHLTQACIPTGQA